MTKINKEIAELIDVLNGILRRMYLWIYVVIFLLCVIEEMGSPLRGKAKLFLINLVDKLPSSLKNKIAMNKG